MYKKFSLKPYNTFGLDVKADYFVQIRSLGDFKSIIANRAFSKFPKLILGGGSNVLFANDFKGMVIQNAISGLKVVEENDDHVWVKVGAGVEWDKFVEYCVSKNWGGLENLSYIPGSVGASPIQNIGAYGVEVKGVIDLVELYNFDTNSLELYVNSECHFAYRSSVFKEKLKGNILITGITFKLTKRNHNLKLNYGNLNQEVNARGGESLKTIREAVIHIRKSKLPEPEDLGNAGSFFKNPVIAEEEFHALQEKYNEIPNYKTDDGVKIPAGWLIEQSGWKGKREGNVGMHNSQALVLVNFGNATGNELVAHSNKVRQSVLEKFGIALTPEVNIID